MVPAFHTTGACFCNCDVVQHQPQAYGLAGCALSQVGNVGPDLGQSYIVDAFMVVVLGGVGQLAGTVYAAMGLGLMNKLLEGLTGAVLAKIAVLVFIIIFIQKRPQGLFAMKGRSAEA
jgi:urea transport system permease protein